jgi:hypothetical protein
MSSLLGSLASAGGAVELGVVGHSLPHQILAGQLTLFQPGDQIMATLLFSPLDFQTFHHSVAASRAESLSFFFPFPLFPYNI